MDVKPGLTPTRHVWEHYTRRISGSKKEDGENYTVMSFTICTPHLILFVMLMKWVGYVAYMDQKCI